MWKAVIESRESRAVPHQDNIIDVNRIEGARRGIDRRSIPHPNGETLNGSHVHTFTGEYTEPDQAGRPFPASPGFGLHGK